MICPFCGTEEIRVLDSRPDEENNAIRRRRECTGCAKRFTTYETIEMAPVLVIKKDGRRQAFDPDKIRNSIYKACEKRSVSAEQVDGLVHEVEKRVQNSFAREIDTQALGEMVMDGLKGLDEVAYVRFASVYRQFRDIQSFMSELEQLLSEGKNGR